MMENVIGRFQKVSFEEYLKQLAANHMVDETNEDLIAEAKAEYDAITMPVRATSGSAGYDFCIPFGMNVHAGQTYVIPTGIRAYIEPGWFLEMVPRSGLGFKYGMRLENTCGIIDGDYFFADNEGHIMLKITARTSFCLNAGDRFAQGIFLPHGITSNDRPLKAARRGGFGSTGV